MAQARFGESKHEAKQVYSQGQQQRGGAWNPAYAPGIHSHKTMHNYLTESRKFCDWAKQTHGSRYMHEAKAHVDDYLQGLVDRGYSPWTVKKAKSALRKAYGDRTLAERVAIPDRKRENVVRSRQPRAHDREFSEEKNRNLVDMCKASGLRRHELKPLQVHSVREIDGRLHLVGVVGKGGRVRNVPIVEAHRERVLEIVHGRRPDEPLIKHIRSRADMHSWRREYSAALYKQITGRDFDRQNYDREAVLEVSRALGHGRAEVILTSYLD